MYKVYMVTGVDSMRRFNNTVFPLPGLVWLPPILSAQPAHGRSQCWPPNMVSFPTDQQAIWRQINIIGPLLLWRRQHFVFDGIDTYSGYVFPFSAWKYFTSSTVHGLIVWLYQSPWYPTWYYLQPGNTFYSNGFIPTEFTGLLCVSCGLLKIHLLWKIGETICSFGVLS